MELNALQLPVELGTIHLKDFGLGAALALALRRGRIDSVLDQYLPESK
jgi:hypothetical protein